MIRIDVSSFAVVATLVAGVIAESVEDVVAVGAEGLPIVIMHDVIYDAEQVV